MVRRRRSFRTSGILEYFLDEKMLHSFPTRKNGRFFSDDRSLVTDLCGQAGLRRRSSFTAVRRWSLSFVHVICSWKKVDRRDALMYSKNGRSVRFGLGGSMAGDIMAKYFAPPSH